MSNQMPRLFRYSVCSLSEKRPADYEHEKQRANHCEQTGQRLVNYRRCGRAMPFRLHNCAADNAEYANDAGSKMDKANRAGFEPFHAR